MLFNKIWHSYCKDDIFAVTFECCLLTLFAVNSRCVYYNSQCVVKNNNTQRLYWSIVFNALFSFWCRLWFCYISQFFPVCKESFSLLAWVFWSLSSDDILTNENSRCYSYVVKHYLDFKEFRFAVVYIWN